MQGIYTYIPETNHVRKEYNVAAIMSLLFMVPISLALALALMYFYISTFQSMCAVSNIARLLRSWIRIPPGVWILVCCVCCMLSGRGLCDELITRPEESYRTWRVVVCDQKTSCDEEPLPALGCTATENNNHNHNLELHIRNKRCLYGIQPCGVGAIYAKRNSISYDECCVPLH
jgi:hypothetical protein